MCVHAFYISACRAPRGHGTTGCQMRGRPREIAGRAQGCKGKSVYDEVVVSDGCGRVSIGCDSSPVVVAGSEE